MMKAYDSVEFQEKDDKGFCIEGGPGEVNIGISRSHEGRDGRDERMWTEYDIDKEQAAQIILFLEGAFT